MGIRQTRASTMDRHAQRAWEEGRSVFVVQLRGEVQHTPELSRPIAGVAEQIEAIEAVGWRMDQFTGVPWKDNMLLTCLFRRPAAQQPNGGPSMRVSW